MLRYDGRMAIKEERFAVWLIGMNKPGSVHVAVGRPDAVRIMELGLNPNRRFNLRSRDTIRQFLEGAPISELGGPPPYNLNFRVVDERSQGVASVHPVSELG